MRPHGVPLTVQVRASRQGLRTHIRLSDPNQFQHFMKNMAIVGGLLGFVAFGGGAYCLDARKS